MLSLCYTNVNRTTTCTHSPCHIMLKLIPVSVGMLTTYVVNFLKETFSANVTYFSWNAPDLNDQSSIFLLYISSFALRRHSSNRISLCGTMLWILRVSLTNCIWWIAYSNHHFCLLYSTTAFNLCGILLPNSSPYMHTKARHYSW